MPVVHNVAELEQNMTTLLKENNFLRQQLSLLDSNNDSTTNTNSTKQSAICSMAELGENNIPQNDHDPPCLYDDINATQAFDLIPGHLFSNFDAALLCNEIDYTHCLSSRKVKFYGDAPYKYGDTLHEPCPVPNNSYLLEIIDQVKRLFPHYSFNSVLINQYDDGTKHIPMHSDDEAQINSDSHIVTISLGESRIMKFQPKHTTQGSETIMNLQHGDRKTIFL